MSNYSNTFNGANKDATNATIFGSDFDTEFNNIATMSATKADKVVTPVANNILMMDSSGNLADSNVAQSNLSGLTGNIQTQLDNKQPLHQNLTDISGLAVTDGNIIVGNGSNFVAESGATARASLGIDGASGVIATGDIADLAISTAKLADTSVTQAKIASAAVGQGELKTATATYTVTSSTTVTSSGGTHCYLWRYRTTNVSYPVVLDPSEGSYTGTSYGRRYAASNSGGGTINPIYIQEYYVQASPPYNLGDGEIPLFIFLLLDSSDINLAISTSPEAPWHYNGPTNIKADFYRNGKGYRLRRDMSAVPFTLEDAKSDPVKLDEYMAAFKAAPIIEEEITQSIKNADMPLIPHPFMGNDLSGKTVVMLDPVCDLMWHLADMCECHDKFNLNELLHEGHIVVNNQPLNRAGPPGVPVVGFKWKNTRGK